MMLGCSRQVPPEFHCEGSAYSGLVKKSIPETRRIEQSCKLGHQSMADNVRLEQISPQLGLLDNLTYQG